MTKVLAFPKCKNKKSNPYNYLLYKGIEDHGVEVEEFSLSRLFFSKFNVVHIHWPEFYLNSAYLIKSVLFSAALILGLLVAKLRGAKVVWTVHNLKPHRIQYPLLNKLFWAAFTPLVDSFISLSNSNKALIHAKHPSFSSLPSEVVYHGLYTDYYPSKQGKEDAKKSLGAEGFDKVILFLGQVKRYKNVEAVIKAFQSTPELNNTLLLIAGKFESSQYFDQVMALADSNDNIKVNNSFISDEDLGVYFGAADMAVLPFKEIFNSGSALLSLSYDVPVLLPKTENFAELSPLFGENMINFYESDLMGRDVIASLDNIAQVKLNATIDEKLTWSYQTAQLAQLFKRLGSSQ